MTRKDTSLEDVATIAFNYHVAKKTGGGCGCGLFFILGGIGIVFMIISYFFSPLIDSIIERVPFYQHLINSFGITGEGDEYLRTMLFVFSSIIGGILYIVFHPYWILILYILFILLSSISDDVDGLKIAKKKYKNELEISNKRKNQEKEKKE